MFGVGRAWLHDYYFAVDVYANMNVDVDKDNEEKHDLAHLPIVMAEFDLFLDDSSL